MISELQREMAALDSEIEDLKNQLASMDGLRQATIRKTREHVTDAIHVLMEEGLEVRFEQLADLAAWEQQ